MGFHVFLEAVFPGFHNKPARFHPRVLITPHLTAGVPTQGRETKGPQGALTFVLYLSQAAGQHSGGGRWGQSSQDPAPDALTS